ncbi:MAG: hypothetical protein K9M97_09960, partial [Akkermansiaceae bacterium]|nr:hypothetical protein [Akkermansiaceae bacterium]
MRAIAIFLTALGALAATGEIRGLAFPTARWFFDASREVPGLHFTGAGGDPGWPWFGWCCAALMMVAGMAMLVRSWGGRHHNPVTEARWRRFRAIKRGHVSLVILLLMGGIAALDQVVVGKRALAVNYQGKWVFPAFLPTEVKNSDFGGTGDDAG